MASITFKSTLSVSLLLIVASFGVGYFLTTPQWNKYQLGKVQLAQIQSDNVRLTADLEAVKTFLESFQEHQKDIPTASLALPLKTSDLANFAASLGDIASSSGVTLSNITIQEGAATAAKAVLDYSMQAVPLTLTASGSFAQFKDFMIRLEDHLRLIDVGHVSLRADDNGIIQYQINLQTYYQK